MSQAQDTTEKLKSGEASAARYGRLCGQAKAPAGFWGFLQSLFAQKPSHFTPRYTLLCDTYLLLKSVPGSLSCSCSSIAKPWPRRFWPQPPLSSPFQDKPDNSLFTVPKLQVFKRRQASGALPSCKISKPKSSRPPGRTSARLLRLTGHCRL